MEVLHVVSCSVRVCVVVLCPSGVSVFNFCEVGFDSLTKLVSGGPRFLVDPTLWHCTLALGWIRSVDRQALHRPHGSLTVRLKHKKNLPDAGFWPAS